MGRRRVLGRRAVQRERLGLRPRVEKLRLGRADRPGHRRGPGLGARQCPERTCGGERVRRARRDQPPLHRLDFRPAGGIGRPQAHPGQGEVELLPVFPQAGLELGELDVSGQRHLRQHRRGSLGRQPGLHQRLGLRPRDRPVDRGPRVRRRPCRDRILAHRRRCESMERGRGAAGLRRRLGRLPLFDRGPLRAGRDDATRREDVVRPRDLPGGRIESAARQLGGLRAARRGRLGHRRLRLRAGALERALWLGGLRWGRPGSSTPR